MAHKVSFDDLKAQVTVAECAAWLGIKLKANRGDCPLCGHDRSFTITPEKKLFGCFHCKVRGSILDMVHHVKQTANVRDAALLLQQHFLGEGKCTTSSTVSAPAERTLPSSTPVRQDEGELKPLDYLDTDHGIIPALGLTPEVCKALGWGYAAKGIMRGRFLVALRTDDGRLVGYLGVATKEEMVPLLSFPSNLADRLAQPETAKDEEAKPYGFLRVVK